MDERILRAIFKTESPLNQHLASPSVKINKEFKVGLLVISALVTLYFGIDFLKGSDVFSSSTTYFVSFQNAEGLTRSNPVRLNGFSVGLVKKITIRQGAAKPILVQLEVSKDLLVGDSAVATLANDGLLGGKVIILETGNLAKTRKSDTLIGTVEVSMTAMLEARGKPIADKAEKVLEGLDKLIASFSTTAERINATVASVEKLSDAGAGLVEGSREDLKKITTNIEMLSSSLIRTEKDLDGLIKKMSKLGDTLNKADIAGTIHSLHTTTEQLNQTMLSINSGKGTMGKLLKNDSLYRNLNASSASLNALLIDFKANPKRYVHFSVFGKKQ